MIEGGTESESAEQKTPSVNKQTRLENARTLNLTKGVPGVGGGNWREAAILRYLRFKFGFT